MNPPTDLDKAYQQFFIKQPAGQYFLTVLNELIATQHTQAEKNPVMSRDYTQRAKGIREILEHIDSVSAEKRPA